MKRLVVMVLLLTSLGAVAQKNDGHKSRRSPKIDLTAEQMATLQTKKMTLALDLTKAQQEKIMKLQLDEATLRKEKWEEMKAKKESGKWQEPTSEERFEMENARLEHQIALQTKMKEILNDEQYQTWKKMKKQKAMHGKKKMQQRGSRG
ncbi:hypothetical protein D2V93_15035 [Flagellimonas taeanensis]|uniref:hypothetical protein n=1 Tax=Flavobacteriaceae TaxID=49546 RepID=UPI000E69967A|nr:MULTISPECIES: hypothetical protein [Allomuricauda]MDC6384902.1 hypothetical protein [Muricauda sp. SK9]RIV49159.1 hypothetical protein D2V93_15035 [Allomuricauda taeanensis]